MRTPQRPGVRFPLTDGDARSTSATGAQIVADSLVNTLPDLADEVRSATAWRRSYVNYFGASTSAAVLSRSSLSIAEEGLRSARRRLVASDGTTEMPLDEWTASARGLRGSDVYQSQVVRGSGPRTQQLSVPYRGRSLSGSALAEQLLVWVKRGVVEPGFADAIQLVIDHPQWLSLPGHRAVLLGAGAAMGPLELLAAWGADVVAVDIPVPAVQERIAAVAACSAGRISVPVGRKSGTPGIDLPSDLGAARRWMAEESSLPGVPILSVNTYADRGAHVEVNLACDVLATDLQSAHPDFMLAFLNTPTDSFLVPEAAMDQARERSHSWRWNGPAHRTASVLSGRRLFQRQYQTALEDDLGGRWGLSDTLVDVQGPNYALAKRLQRWRAVLEHNSGRRVSTTVAPASWTRSVTKNRVLASVYAGASPFGIEVFEADTARALMAAKLVADTYRAPRERTEHPESVFADAAHGGLWRQPFQPRSALGVAALVGAPSNAVRRRR